MSVSMDSDKIFFKRIDTDITMKQDKQFFSVKDIEEGQKDRHPEKKPLLQLPTCSGICIEAKHVSYNVIIQNDRRRLQPIVSTFLSITHRLFKTPKPCPPATQRVLKDLSFSIKNGILVALMGASGAGKSTLLNILSGRLPCTEGCILYNGNRISKSLCQNTSAYVEQEDLFIPDITADEHLRCQLKLRLPRNTKKSDYDESAEILFHDLELLKCRFNKICTGTEELGGLSGGEKRRLSIASELCRFPMIVFADEPTTGLDYHTAKSVVRHLKYLADSGRTVIASIHQPSSEIFDMFDHVVLLAEGQILYDGDRVGCIAWFEKLGHICPTLHNPADFIIAKTSVPNHPRHRQEKLALLNRWANQWAKEGGVFRRNNRTSQWYKKVKSFQNLQRQCVSGGSIVLSQGFPENESGSFYSISKSATHFGSQGESLEHGSTSEVLSKCSLVDKIEWNRPTWFQQVLILYQRAFLYSLRNRIQFMSRALQNFVLAFVLGFLFFRLQWNLPDSTARIGATYMILINQSMSGAFMVVNTFFLEKPIIYREYSAGLIDPSAYFVAKMLADLVAQIIFPIIFISITFWLIQLGSDFWTFVKTTIIGILLANSAISVGYLSSAVGSSPEMAALICNLITFPLSMFGGFLVSIQDTKPFLSWIQHISFVKHGFFAALNVIFKGQQVCCVDGSPVDGLQFINQRLGVPKISFTSSFFILLAVFVIYRSIAIVGGCISMKWAYFYQSV